MSQILFDLQKEKYEMKTLKEILEEHNFALIDNCSALATFREIPFFQNPSYDSLEESQEKLHFLFEQSQQLKKYSAQSGHNMLLMPESIRREYLDGINLLGKHLYDDSKTNSPFGILKRFKDKQTGQMIGRTYTNHREAYLNFHFNQALDRYLGFGFRDIKKRNIKIPSPLQHFRSYGDFEIFVLGSILEKYDIPIITSDRDIQNLPNLLENNREISPIIYRSSDSFSTIFSRI